MNHCSDLADIFKIFFSLLGQSIAVIIAMKMEYVLKATTSGTVRSIAGKVGDNIGKGVTIVEIDQE